jgi:hypothetical protein
MYSFLIFFAVVPNLDLILESNKPDHAWQVFCLKQLFKVVIEEWVHKAFLTGVHLSGYSKHQFIIAALELFKGPTRREIDFEFGHNNKGFQNRR